MFFNRPSATDAGTYFGSSQPISSEVQFIRRICPGRHLGLNSAWLGMAAILSTFSITKALDKNGKPIEPIVGTTGGNVT